ncbi:MAG: DHH family phosphoesterase [Spirochaetales bacterium]|nr:DHH family phosphoesterase [Spirochaetales bacterium]
MTDFNSQLEKKFGLFKSLLENKRELLVIIHNNPDPDALASAFALSYLAEMLSDIDSSIGYGGNIGRIENQKMVSLLKIKLKQIGRIKLSKYDLIAFVDTQPAAGNNSYTVERGCDIVIDHHPKMRGLQADLIIVNPNIGATASILVAWLKYSKIAISSDVATALSYAISSETGNMHREASPFDIESYLYIYSKSNMQNLARIMNPALPHVYYLFVMRALKHAILYRNLMVSHIGEVFSPEFVAEMADFFVRHRNISWCLCTGVYRKNLYLSLRSTKKKARANIIIKNLVENKQNVGGHEQAAGGFIEIKSLKKADLQKLYLKLTQITALKTGNTSETEKLDFKPLIEKEYYTDSEKDAL